MEKLSRSEYQEMKKAIKRQEQLEIVLAFMIGLFIFTTTIYMIIYLGTRIF